MAQPTSTAAASGTVSITATPSATAKPSSDVAFTVYAVRVSKVNNPGNLQGLASVKRGSSVWLMVYFKVTQLPGKVKRLVTYSINQGSHVFYRAVYKSVQTPGEIGSFSRYVAYKIPPNLPLGRYSFHAILRLRNTVHSRSWHFTVGNHERVATDRTG